MRRREFIAGLGSAAACQLRRVDSERAHAAGRRVDGSEESNLEAKAFLSTLRAFSSFAQWPSGLANSGVRYEAAAIH
jgi:hypothetical protein